MPDEGLHNSGIRADCAYSYKQDQIQQEAHSCEPFDNLDHRYHLHQTTLSKIHAHNVVNNQRNLIRQRSTAVLHCQ